MIHSIQALWLGSTWDPPHPMPQTNPGDFDMPEDWTDGPMSYGNTSFFDGVSSISLEKYRQNRPVSWRLVRLPGLPVVGSDLQFWRHRIV